MSKHSQKEYDQTQKAISKARTAYDMMDIISTSLVVAKRCLAKIDNDDPRDSMRLSLKVVENDIASIKDQLADLISDYTDDLNNFTKEN